jgi:hypothetical protein
VGGSGKGRHRPVLSDEVLGRLRDELRSQRDRGAEPYPIRVTRLFELAGVPADDAALRELVNPRSGKWLRVTAKQRRPDNGHYSEALAFLADDVDRIVEGPSLVQHALRRLRSDKTHAFTLAQLTDALPTFLQTRFRAAVKRRADAGELWSEVASALYRGNLLFLPLERPAAAAAPTPDPDASPRGGGDGHSRGGGDGHSSDDNGRPPGSNGSGEPAPAEFAGVFEREFERLDRASGGNNYVLLHDLRQALSDYERSEFDEQLRELRQARRYTLDSSDGRQVRLSHEQLDAGIREGSSLLVYVARR